MELKRLKDIQGEIRLWADEQFGVNLSKDTGGVTFGSPLGSLPALLGMAEEVGELCHVVVYRLQGRGFHDPKEALAAKEDALADILVYACDFAGREGICLESVLNQVWAKVCKRRGASWASDKAKEHVAPTNDLQLYDKEVSL